MFLREDLLLEVMEMVEERDNRFRKSQNGDQRPPLQLLTLDVKHRKNNNTGRRKDGDQEKRISAWQNLGPKVKKDVKGHKKSPRKQTSKPSEDPEQPLITEQDTPVEQTTEALIEPLPPEHTEPDSTEPIQPEQTSGDSKQQYVELPTEEIPVEELQIEGEVTDLVGDTEKSGAPKDTDKAKTARSINSGIGFAIFVTFLCCIPLGAVALYYSVRASKSLSSNDVTSARRKARMSCTLSIAAICLGTAVYITIALVELWLVYYNPDHG